MFQYKFLKIKWTEIIILLVVVVFLLVGAFVYQLTQPVTSEAGEPIVIVVKSGMTTDAIGGLLYQKGIIKSVALFQAIAKKERMENSLQAGEYAFTPNMSVTKIVGMLARGETTYQLLTIPEGYTVVQIANLLAEKKIGSAVKFKTLAQKFAPYEYMSTKDNVLYKAEGFVFPDTYHLSRIMTEEEILTMLVSQFNERFTAAMRAQANDMGLSIYDVIILASLVEKEAQLPEDRPIIAGVFRNRLKNEMPLQSCATIQYILGYPKPELTIRDTEIASPYNTYQHSGLPPGPIANPGIAAIEAVLHATSTEYLYFVADRQGAHHFSKTYAEHLAMIEKVR